MESRWNRPRARLASYTRFRRVYGDSIIGYAFLPSTEINESAGALTASGLSLAESERTL